MSSTVIQNEIRYHCGPDAIVRPYTNQGRDDFLVTMSSPSSTKGENESPRDTIRTLITLDGGCPIILECDQVKCYYGEP